MFLKRRPDSWHQRVVPTGRWALLVAVWLVAAPRVMAQSASMSTAADQQDPDALSLQQLLDVEVQSVFGASKFLQKTTEAPASVTVVTAEEIARYGWATLADVLRNVRGFYVTDDRCYAYVGMRGFLRPGDFTTRILLLVDGHRVNDNVYDQALIQEDFLVELDDVERIEIVRGPSSSLYGSNAFFGVVNVITRPTGTGGTGLAARLGTLGLRSARASAGRTLPGGTAFSLSATVRHMDGMGQLYYPEYDAPDTSDGVASGLDYSRGRNVLGSLAYRALSVRAGYNTRTRGMPTGAYETVFDDPRASVTDTHAFGDVAFERSIGGGWSGRFRGAYDYYHYLGDLPYAWDESGAGRAVLYKDIGTGEWLTGEAQLSRRLGTRHRLTVGAEHRRNLQQMQTTMLDDTLDWADHRHSSTSALFAQDEFRLHRTLLVNAGIRYDRYDGFTDPVKPRFAAIYQPVERTTVKFVYGEAFRAPNVFEIFHVTPGVYKANPDLRAEQMRTVEAIVEQFAGKRLRLSGSVFSYTVDDLIDFVNDPADGLGWYRNVASARASGVEAEAEAKWPSGVQGRVSYTYSRVRDGETGVPLTNSPAHLVQSLFSFPLSHGVFAGIEARSVSARLTRTGGTAEGYLVSNLTLSGPLVADRLRVSFTLANITNRRYDDPVSGDFTQDTIVQNGRTGRVRVTYGF